MHGVCDYSAIHTSKLETGPHGSINNPVSFTLGANAVLNVHAILTFTVKVDGDTLTQTGEILGTSLKEIYKRLD